jgi:hypothetical protein
VKISDLQIANIENDRTLRPSHENPSDRRLLAYVDIVRTQYMGVSGARWREMPGLGQIMDYLFRRGVHRYRVVIPAPNKKAHARLADV